jgi:hypothetical protein
MMPVITLTKAKAMKTNSTVRPISIDTPAMLFAPNNIAKSPNIKKPIATLNMFYLLNMNHAVTDDETPGLEDRSVNPDPCPHTRNPSAETGHDHAWRQGEA